MTKLKGCYIMCLLNKQRSDGMYNTDDLIGIKDGNAFLRADGERYRLLVIDAERKLEKLKYERRAGYDKSTH